MASSDHCSKITGKVTVNFQIDEHSYQNIQLFVMENLCMDIILGLEFQSLHRSVTVKFDGPKLPLIICGLSTLNIEPPRLFSNLVPECKPIAARSRRYSSKDKQFIKSETIRMLNEGIIEPSNSPWRAQTVVVKEKKERLVIDYSETINRFTQLDAYPLPRINEYLNQIAQYKIFSKIDLKSAYHQMTSHTRRLKQTAL